MEDTTRAAPKSGCGDVAASLGDPTSPLTPVHHPYPPPSALCSPLPTHAPRSTHNPPELISTNKSGGPGPDPPKRRSFHHRRWGFGAYLFSSPNT